MLRARAFLDLLLGKDSALPGPRRRDGAGPGRRPGRAAGTGPSLPRPGPRWRGAGSLGGHPTVPLATLLDLADRPGEIPGIGPVDPWLARDLAAVAAWNPRRPVRDRA